MIFNCFIVKQTYTLCIVFLLKKGTQAGRYCLSEGTWNFYDALCTLGTWKKRGVKVDNLSMGNGSQLVKKIIGLDIKR